MRSRWAVESTGWRGRACGICGTAEQWTSQGLEKKGTGSKLKTLCSSSALFRFCFGRTDSPFVKTAWRRRRRHLPRTHSPLVRKRHSARLVHRRHRGCWRTARKQRCTPEPLLCLAHRLPGRQVGVAAHPSPPAKPRPAKPSPHHRCLLPFPRSHLHLQRHHCGLPQCRRPTTPAATTHPQPACPPPACIPNTLAAAVHRPASPKHSRNRRMVAHPSTTTTANARPFPPQDRRYDRHGGHCPARTPPPLTSTLPVTLPTPAGTIYRVCCST